MAAAAGLENLASALFPRADVMTVGKAFEHPFRDLVRLHLAQVESLVTALMAYGGKEENVPIAIARLFIERLEDPVLVAKMMLNAAAKGNEGLPFVPGPL